MSRAMLSVSRLRSTALAATLSLSSLLAVAQHINTASAIFDNNFKTLQTVVNDDFMLNPVLRLGANDILTVSFDEIGDDYSQLQYRILHCNSDWQPSTLVDSEYLDGFNIADIDDFAFSSNTFVHYVNYQLSIPNENIALLVSGNYLLQVFDRDNPDRTLLQTRFYVSENAVPVAGEISTRTDRSFNDTYQQVNLMIHNSASVIPNPYQDIIVTVSQNHRPDATSTVRNPFRVQGEDIVFEHNKDLIFTAGNEFRRFETVRADYPGMNVDSVAFMGTNYHAWLAQDRPRHESSHIFDSTQRGRFLIREYNATDSNLGADYVTVHFSLNYPDSDLAEIYLDGDFVRNLPLSSRRLNYDSATGLYTTQIPLKQGSYNYQYLRRDTDGHLSASPVEGDKYETRNEYLVNVYLRTPTQRADRLIGSATIIDY